MFQSTVNRNYTTGFPGEFAKDGPHRLKPARIASATLGTDPGASTNRVSRAFGFSADGAETGTTFGSFNEQVVVGGANFFGLLAHPKHYALSGVVGNTLGASFDLPQGVNAEFADMAVLFIELFNDTTAAKAVAFGDGLAYVSSDITTAQNPLALPYGALVSVPKGGTVADGFVLIPNARIINPVSLVASAAGSLVSSYTIGQLTQ